MTIKTKDSSSKPKSTKRALVKNAAKAALDLTTARLASLEELYDWVLEEGEQCPEGESPRKKLERFSDYAHMIEGLGILINADYQAIELLNDIVGRSSPKRGRSKV